MSRGGGPTCRALTLWRCIEKGRTPNPKGAENERLPTELGWSVKEDAVTLENILALSEMLRNATSLITDSTESPKTAPRGRDLHAGVRPNAEQKRSGCPYAGSL